MNRLRWRLARWFAPRPIIAAPNGPDTGAFIYYRSGRHSVWVTVKTLDMNIENTVRSYLDTEPTTLYVPSNRNGVFSGTL